MEKITVNRNMKNLLKIGAFLFYELIKYTYEHLILMLKFPIQYISIGTIKFVIYVQTFNVNAEA